MKAKWAGSWGRGRHTGAVRPGLARDMAAAGGRVWSGGWGVPDGLLGGRARWATGLGVGRPCGGYDLVLAAGGVEAAQAARSVLPDRCDQLPPKREGGGGGALGRCRGWGRSVGGQSTGAEAPLATARDGAVAAPAHSPRTAGRRAKALCGGNGWGRGRAHYFAHLRRGGRERGLRRSLERERRQVGQRVERLPRLDPHAHRVCQLGEVGVNVPQAGAHLGGMGGCAIRLRMPLCDARGACAIRMQMPLCDARGGMWPTWPSHAQTSFAHICKEWPPSHTHLVCHLQVALCHAGRVFGQLQGLEKWDDLLLRAAGGQRGGWGRVGWGGGR